jgi:murein DD-endopeptidase MepM/ murein hydrolase activator NlpD
MQTYDNGLVERRRPKFRSDRWVRRTIAGNVATGCVAPARSSDRECRVLEGACLVAAESTPGDVAGTRTPLGINLAVGAIAMAGTAGVDGALFKEESGRLVKLGYRVDPWTRFDVAETGDGWSASAIETARDVRVEVRQGEVHQSLWNAVDGGALSASALLELVQIFESEFDFAADTQPGDRFRLLVEARYADGAFVDYGRILAAQYVSDGKALTGVGFEEQGRFKYYDAEGRSLRKMFLRSPLEFTRISSGFTYRRPHPILGGVRPHLAIDYAAPTGTPVWAVADGVVMFAGRKGGNGIHVRLRHRGGYDTYYNHLSRVAPGMRTGVRVSQAGDRHVGSTGFNRPAPRLPRLAQRQVRQPAEREVLPG